MPQTYRSKIEEQPMPNRASFTTAVSLGSAVMFAAMAGLTIMGGVLAQSAVTGKKWSEEMTATTLNGVSIMLVSGGVMVVLAIVCGLLGWRLARGRR
jgi:cytochrome c oxidase assembly factor CtaG